MEANDVKKGSLVRHRDFHDLDIGKVLAVYGRGPNAMFEVAFTRPRPGAPELSGSVTLPFSKLAPLHPLEQLALECGDL